MTQKFSGFVDANGVFFPGRNNRLVDRLPAGAYEVKVTAEGQLYFETFSINHDNILDMPSKAYSQVVSEMEYFLRPETISSFKDYGFIYKRSALLFGPPGGGKTVIVGRVAREVIKKGGVVLFNPRPDVMSDAFTVLDNTQPDSTVMVIFEEFDELVESWEHELLSLLDGEVQKNNVVYIATTNHIEKVPKRILRPGRMSTVVEVGYPDDAAREFYFKHKLKSHEDLAEYVAASVNFSVDEMKELVLATKCLGLSMVEVSERILKVKGMSDRDDFEESEASLNQLMARSLAGMRKRR